VSFSWMLHSLGKIGWAAAFIYASCAALRLARFNTQVNIVDKLFFVGLASPAAAAIVSGMVWVGYDISPSQPTAVLAAIITSAAGLLMVSNLKYKSLKGLDLKGKVPFVAILAVVMLVVLISIDPPAILLIMALAYALSAPVYWGLRRLRRKEPKSEEQTDAGNSP
jgi:CDP-diacylglycerol---serine O-phosphatidyltransferase